MLQLYCSFKICRKQISDCDGTYIHRNRGLLHTRVDHCGGYLWKLQVEMGICFGGYKYLLNLKLFGIMWLCLRFRKNFAKCTREENGLYCGNAETTAIIKTYEILVSLHLVS
jgi:hypothetical protein